MKPPQVIIGGDPELTRRMLRDNPVAAAAYLATEAAQSIEVPCQKCGRAVLLAPSGQTIALGDPSIVHKINVGEDDDVTCGPPEKIEGAVAVMCMWCAFAGQPEILAVLEKAMGGAE